MFIKDIKCGKCGTARESIEDIRFGPINTSKPIFCNHCREEIRKEQRASKQIFAVIINASIDEARSKTNTENATGQRFKRTNAGKLMAAHELNYQRQVQKQIDEESGI